MKTIFISPKKEGKGRTFAAVLLAYATADSLWAGGETAGEKVTRPAWMMFAAGEGEVRPFTANLRLGRAAELGKDRWSRRKAESFELLKSAGYAFSTQRFAEGTVVTAFLPEVFRLDPGMVDPTGVRFAMLPPRAWLARHPVDLELAVTHADACGLVGRGKPDPYETMPALPTDDEVRRLAPLATPFAAYLDRRTRAPLVADFRFHVQVLIACLARGLASLSCESGYYGDRRRSFGSHPAIGFFEQDVEVVGLAPGVAVKANHLELETVLAEQAALFFREVDRG